MYAAAAWMETGRTTPYRARQYILTDPPAVGAKRRRIDAK
jgi:hypothetical protein